MATVVGKEERAEERGEVEFTQHSCHSAHLLVCQHRAALKCRQVAVEQGSAGSVVLTEDCTVDIVEAVAGH